MASEMSYKQQNKLMHTAVRPDSLADSSKTGDIYMHISGASS